LQALKEVDWVHFFRQGAKNAGERNFSFWSGVTRFCRHMVCEYEQYWICFKGWSDMEKLSDLQPGSTAVVKEVAGEGSLRRRLLEMGILAGSTVEVVRKAPLGDPVEIRVRGYNLSLRRNEADTVMVTRS